MRQRPADVYRNANIDQRASGLPARKTVRSGRIVAKRDPGDTVELLWSASARSGLDRTILEAFSGCRCLPGRWHELVNLDAVMAALDDLVARERDLAVHENALQESQRFHAAAVNAAHDAFENAVEALAYAPQTFTAQEAGEKSRRLDFSGQALAPPRATIVRLVRARAGGATMNDRNSFLIGLAVAALSGAVVGVIGGACGAVLADGVCFEFPERGRRRGPVNE